MIRHEKTDSVDWIGFESRYNALSSKMLNELHRLLDELAMAENPGITVFYGVGDRFFCTGADPEEIRSYETPDEFAGFCRLFTETLQKIESLPGPTLASVAGKSAGSGVSIARACDLNLGLKGCSFRMSEMLFGFDPMIVIDPLKKKMGNAFARHMVLNPSIFFDDAWATNAGLLDQVCKTPKERDVKINRRIKEWSEANPKAIRQWKSKNRFMASAKVLDERISITAKMMSKIALNRKNKKSHSSIKYGESNEDRNIEER